MGIDLHSCEICKEAKTSYDGWCTLGCSKCLGNSWICYDCLDEDSPLFQEQDKETNKLVCEVCKNYVIEKAKRENDKTELNKIIDIINKSKLSKKDKCSIINILINK